MKFLKLFAEVLLCCSLNTAKAQLPAPEQLLPDDTFAVLTAPDWTKALSAFKQSAYGQLWDDPSVKPFREKFEKTFGTDVKEPLQKKFGINLQEYKSLLQGQLTIAFTPPREGSDDPVGLLILLDAKSKSEALANKLSDLRKKLADSGRKFQTEKIRDTDFTVITITQAEMKQFWSKIFSKGEDDEDGDQEDTGDDKDKKDLQLRIGQSKSLLVIGENPKVIEKVLARQNGGSVPVLGDQAAFQKNRAVSARDALAYGWLNWKPVYDLIMKNLSKSEEKEDAAPGMPNLKPEKIVEAVGLKAIQSFGFSISGNADGNGGEFFLAIPESERQGLFKVFNLQLKDCSPPPFVPADAVKFQRWRIDAQKAWAALEETVSKIDPSIAAMVQLGLSTAGKDKDPNFDFKKSFIENIGDDFMSYQKLPKGTKITDIGSPPTLFLIGSQHPEQVVDAIRLVTSLLPPTMSANPPKEREFLGKKIYTLTGASPLAGQDEDEKPKTEDKDKTPPPPAQTFNFTASGGYVAMSGDPALLEEYIRSAEQSGKSLRETPGLNEAASKTGGMDKGFFGYENQKESMRFVMNVLKNDKEGLDKLFSLSMTLKVTDEGGEKNTLKEWFDYSLLPNFDQIAKYFYLAIYSGTATSDGFSFRGYTPTPPQLKK